MSISHFKAASEWALMIALVFGAGAFAQAKNEAAPDDGPVIQIGRSDGSDTSAPQTEAPAQPQAPKFWIGLLAGQITADHPLRAHLDLPEKQGLLVASVVPNSPAAKAGLKPNDILLKANDADLHEMTDLVDVVATEGAKKGQITLEVFRRGNRESVNVTPEDRPAEAQVPQGPEGGNVPGGFDLQGGDAANMAQQLLREFQGGAGPQRLEFRNFGPGVIVGGEGGAASMPDGVSVSIQKENDKPAKVTVKRGDKTWEVNGDDPESLKQLPDDVRPYVEQLLHGNAGGRLNFGGEGPQRPVLEDGRMRDRLERMEKRMDEMMQRLQERREADQPKAEEQSK